MDIFVHIPKSSGSTIRTVLSREYGVRHILYYEAGNKAWKLNASNEEPLPKQVSRQSTKLITGHTGFGLHELLVQPCRYFSLIRDPLERALSEYYYAFSYPHHKFRDEITSGRIPPEEFITNDKYVSGAIQTDFLSGRAHSRGKLLTTALENLRVSFVLVGLAERFDESMLLAAKRLGWNPPLYVRRNVTPMTKAHRNERERISQLATAAIKQHFQPDYKLYDAVTDAFNATIAAEGIAFQRAFSAFQEMQAEIGRHASRKIHDLYEFHGDDVLPDVAKRFFGSSVYGQVRDYLADNADKRPKPRNYMGKVDRLAGGVIAGWAVDLFSPGEPLEVAIWRDGRLLTRARCEIFRPDLENAGLPGEHAGFRVEVDAASFEPARYSVTFGDSELLLR